MHIEFDAAKFDPKRITAVRHDFATHPLLTVESLLSLARRLPQKQVRFHANTARADSDFERTEKEHPHHLGLQEAMANMETSGSWIAFHNAQTDPLYKGLLDEALSEVQGRIEDKDPGMFNRGMWIFVQSPNAVTPFHIDHEQNFLMQVKGRKKAMLWHAEDCITDHALEVFHSQWHRKEVKYEPQYAASAQTFELEPGMGAYMPSTGPHLVSNYDNVSITLSLTYCTNETRRIETVYRCNNAFRKLGLKPGAVGRSALADSSKRALYGSFLAARAAIKGDRSDIPGWARL
ncbi:MAG: cupin-like domain-containing protein [Gemmatimonadaceae bacterium]